MAVEPAELLSKLSSDVHQMPTIAQLELAPLKRQTPPSLSVSPGRVICGLVNAGGLVSGPQCRAVEYCPIYLRLAINLKRRVDISNIATTPIAPATPTESRPSLMPVIE